MLRSPTLTLATLVAVLMLLAADPLAAEAHGPSVPVATDFVARVEHAPAGVQAKVVDGDLQMWLQVPPAMTVLVLDYRGAPYLRFSRAGVQVNRNSDMYYLNALPLAQTPPANLTRSTPPSWETVSSGHAYTWHDSRLGALADIALPPDTTSRVGPWSIALVLDGRRASVSGGVFHAGAPSLVWLWFVVVVFACALAAWRVRRPALDERMARSLAAGALIAFALGAAAQDLHGRPSVTVVQLAELAVTAVFVAWGLWRILRAPPGYFLCLVIALLALWEGLVLFPTLTHGFALLALPGFVVRVAAVACLGAGAALLPAVFRLAAAATTRTQARRRRVRSAAAAPRRERSAAG